MSGSYYIGVTIGPIYKAIMSSKKTRELWGTSFIFSEIMYNLYTKIKDSIGEDKIIVPSVSEDIIGARELLSPKPGLFHDRLIFKDPENGMELLDGIIESVLEEWSEKISKTINSEENETLNNEKSQTKKVDSRDILEYLKKYLLLSRIRCLLEDKPSSILKLQDYLSALENDNPFLPSYQDYKVRTHDNLERNTGYINAYWLKNKSGKIPNLYEIASRAFGNEASEVVKEIKGENYNIFFDKLKKKLKEKSIEKEFLKAHKYVAYVKADGDNMGKFIKKLKDLDMLKKFSLKLMSYAVGKAHSQLLEFGALPIYISGDDIFFIAPVLAGRQGDSSQYSVFELLQRLSDTFNEEMENILQDLDRTDKIGDLPTLSFGIVLSYHKYPMRECIDMAHRILEDKAKKQPEKNSVAVRLHKHSGSFVEMVFSLKGSKGDSEFAQFCKLIRSAWNEEYKILSSLRYKLIQNKILIRKALSNNAKELRPFEINLNSNELKNQQLENLFKNTLDEKIHLEHKHDTFLKIFREQLQNCYARRMDLWLQELTEEMENEADRTVDHVVGILKILSFLKEGDGGV
ncbi:MAG: Cas10/Cmr2 second palm domain-containing protein [Bacillota bacterium]